MEDLDTDEGKAATICILGKALEMQGLVSPGAISPRSASVTP